MLLKHGARIDVEARMCWPGPHQQNCEERGKHTTIANIAAERKSFSKVGQCLNPRKAPITASKSLLPPTMAPTSCDNTATGTSGAATTTTAWGTGWATASATRSGWVGMGQGGEAYLGQGRHRTLSRSDSWQLWVRSHQRATWHLCPCSCTFASLLLRLGVARGWSWLAPGAIGTAARPTAGPRGSLDRGAVDCYYKIKQL